jgi:hypothetical protein
VDATVTTVNDDWLSENLRLPSVLIVDIPDWCGYAVSMRLERMFDRYHPQVINLTLNTPTQTEPPDLPTAALMQVAVETFARDTLAKLDAPRVRIVALMYQMAESMCAPPRKLVADSFGVATSTAARWINEARAAGLLANVPMGRGGRPRRRLA